MKKSSLFNNSIKKIHMVLFVYWFILVIWQNIRSGDNRSGMDVIIKVSLLLFLVCCYLFKSHKVNRNALLISYIWFFCYLVTFFKDKSGFNLGIMIPYIFPVLFFFLTFAIGHKFEITKKELLVFLNCNIAIVLYMVVYALLFCSDQFFNAFSLQSAYGNELSSFLVSNMEYGMYLLFGIIACIICLELNEKLNKFQRMCYYFIVVLFAINLVLTFSRTSIIAFIVLMLLYVFFAKSKKTKKIILFLFVIAIAAILLLPSLQEFFVDIVFKGNADSGRSELANIGLNIYQSSSLDRIFFGNGFSNVSDMIELSSIHSNTHNGYIQVLLATGICGLIITVGILVVQFIINLKFIQQAKKYSFLLILYAGSVLIAAVYMMTSTCTIFYSNIDAYYLTIMAFIIPKYVRNAIKAETFDEK